MEPSAILAVEAVCTALLYLLAGLGGNLAGLAFGAGRGMSVGASGAVFGLFTVSVLSRLAELVDWRKVVEVLVLGEFVVSKVCALPSH